MHRHFLTLATLLLPCCVKVQSIQVPAFHQWTYDGCADHQRKAIRDAVQDAIQLSNHSLTNLSANDSAFIDFFGASDSFQGREPQNVSITIRTALDSITKERFILHSFCPGTNNTEKKNYCQRRENKEDGGFGDVIGTRGAEPIIEIMFCTSFFDLNGLQERIKWAKEELMWYDRLSLESYFRNQATSVMHELIRLSPVGTDIYHVWMEIEGGNTTMFLGAFGPLAAKILSRTSSDINWAVLSANNYAMFSLSRYLESHMEIAKYPFLPVIDQAPDSPGSTVSIGNLLEYANDRFVVNTTAYRARTSHLRYIQDVAPQNYSSIDVRIAHPNGSVLVPYGELPVEFTQSRDMELNKYLELLRSHPETGNIKLYPDVDARACVREDVDEPFKGIDREQAKAAIEGACGQLPYTDDILIVPKIFFATDKTIDGKKRSSEVLYELPDTGDARHTLWMKVEIAHGCATSVHLRDIFIGEGIQKKNQFCMDMFLDPINKCGPEALIFGGHVTTNCITYSIQYLPQDVKPICASKIKCHSGHPLIDPGSPNYHKVCSCYAEDIPQVKGVFCLRNDLMCAETTVPKELQYEHDVFEMQKVSQYCPYSNMVVS